MKHPLRSTGTHQTARLLRAIAPGHFRLDERSMQDLITAAHSYARMLTYIGPNGKPDGDWAAFWEVENLTYMAVLAAIDTRQLRRDYENIDFEWGNALQQEQERPLKSRKKNSTEPTSPQYLRQALCQLRDMSGRLEKYYSTLREAVPLKAHILSLIRKANAFEYMPDEVDGTLQQLIGYHKGADDHLDPLSYREFWQSDFRWGIRDRDEYDCILPVEDCSRQQVRDLFVQLYRVFIALQAHAQQMFEEELARIEQSEETLERRLEPHIALFIAFLRLFRHAQDGMNDLPRRHLDFYYNSVLCLERKPAQPDHAYLIFTLAKEFDQELVEKGTLLLAGKDKKGRPIQFETLERWKVTKATIEEIRNTAIMPDYINASTISEKSVPPATAFRPFGDDNSAPQGELGFAIASPQLLLREGKRKVTILMELAGKIEYANIFASEVQVKYSTGEGYHNLSKLTTDKEGNFNGFLLNPSVTPFEPLKTVEPARRILSQLMSDEVTTAFSVSGNSPALLQILHDLYQRYDRAAANTPFNAPPDVNTAAWFEKNFYYPALSGIYLISTILRQSEEPPEDGPNQYEAQLYFYRAYYLWCLATICCPVPQFKTAPKNDTLLTDIPDLTSTSLTALQYFTLKGIYDQIHDDLLNSLKSLTGKTAISSPADLSGIEISPASNTSINIYTVCAMLSRHHLQLGEWDTCRDWSQIITKSTHYQAGGPVKDDTDREATASRVFKSIFEEVESSKEVIWAMNAVSGNQTGDSGTSSLFSILGSRDLYAAKTNTLYLEESSLLNEVNKQNLRYDERSSPPSAPSAPPESTPADTTEGSSAMKSAKSPSKTSKKQAQAAGDIDPEINTYDYRDKVAYREETSSHWFTDKYFLSPTAPYVPMIRLAEIMLNEAWCILQPAVAGTNDDARALLNTLRERAGALPFKKKVDDSDIEGLQVPTIILAHVEEERMRELAFEGDRRDFVRLARSSMASRSYVVKETDLNVLVLGPNVYLPPAQDILILTNDGVAKAPINWDSSWLYMGDMLPQPGKVDINSIKDLELSSSLSLTLILKEDAPAFLPDPILLASHGVKHPVVRVTFNGTDKQGKGSGFYNFLKNQTLTQATITTEVSGIQKSLILQNDFGVFDGTQRFYPFGPVPENSARFFLGCQEAFSKTLSKVGIDFDWVEEETIAKGLSGYENVYEHYQSLKIVPPAELVAQAVQTNTPLFGTIFLPLPNLSVPKFAQAAHADTAAEAANQAIPYPRPRVTIDLLKDADFGENKILPETSWFTTALTFANATGDALAKNKSKMRALFKDLPVTQFERASTAEQVAKYSATQKRGFLKFTLIGDFGHTAYPKLVMEATSKQPAGPIPHEPYTPATNSVSLSYDSTQIMEDPKPGQARLDHFFHLLPFDGIVEARFDGHTSLVYGYPIQPPPEAPTSGYFPASLFLGMKNLVAGDNLSLLFQTQEASEPLPNARPPKVRWMYLQADNLWARIPAERILRDTTRGLTRSGILQIATPNDLSSRGNTLLNPQLLWLRAAVLQTDAPERVGAFPALLDIKAQAIEAQFLPGEANDLSRLSDPLPAQSVTGLAQSSSAVKKVEQPFDSFGGQAPEVEGSPEYYRRISERLSHKDRAVSASDYERLLLEAYPTVAIAKCIPHTRYESTEGYPLASELAPGFVSVAVVPDLSRHPNMVRTTPRFSRGDLEEMRDTLLPHTNAFVQTRENKATGERTDFLQVVNPRYEPVSLAVKVWLTRGTDQSWAIYQLEQVLRRFLAPWLEDPTHLPQFSRPVRRSHLIQLIEQQDFVDAIQELAIFHFPEGAAEGGGKPAHTSPDSENWIEVWKTHLVVGSVINPGSARSILTTGEHLIEIAEGVGGTGSPAPRRALAPPSPGPIPDEEQEADTRIPGAAPALTPVPASRKKAATKSRSPKTPKK